MASPEYNYGYRNSLLGGGYGNSLLSGLTPLALVKHKIFISYHHANDQTYYTAFSNSFHDTYDVIYDNSLERQVDSDNPLYVMQRIRDTCITGSSCTIVLVGSQTSRRKYVDWEIKGTLDAEHGLIGVQLPTLPIPPNGKVTVPGRLYDNIQSGYALWLTWQQITSSVENLQTYIAQAKARGAALIDNARPRMQVNLPNF
jgi:hypothetical protein